MSDSPFPIEVPKVGDLLRITPERVDYVTTHYKDFCEEAYVTSRFIATDYEGNPIIEVSLGGRLLVEPLRYSAQKQMWLIFFDQQDRMVNIEILME